ncbi:hypothetical protein QVD17_08267 [Tagetes erecta]|uniref:Uncharacterized protein n=1 Tax=Tagetes erecta TaxID=13708 RepID=A0AAD8L2S5_TARER|nr:hypothetical protein QVD17_08267 [Tagetes erecta]
MPITFFAIVNQKNVYTLVLSPVVKRLVKSFKIPVGILKLYYEDTFFEVMLHESNDHYFLSEGWETIDYLNLTSMGIILFNFDETCTRFSFSFIHANRKYSLGNTFVHFMEKKIPKGLNFIKRFFSDSPPKNSVPDEEVDDEFMSILDAPPGFTKKYGACTSSSPVVTKSITPSSSSKKPGTGTFEINCSDPNIYWFKQILQNRVHLSKHFLEFFGLKVGVLIKVSYEQYSPLQLMITTEKNGIYKRPMLHEWRSFMRLYGLSRGVPCQFVWFRLGNVLNEKHFVVLGTIKMLEKDHGWFYLACRHCTKKALTKTQYLEKSNEIPANFFDTPIDSLWEVSKIVGLSASDIRDRQVKAGDTEDFPQELNFMMNKLLAFKIMISNFNVNNKHYVYTVNKICDDPDIIAELESTHAIDETTHDEGDLNSEKLSDSLDAVSYSADSLAVDLDKNSGNSPPVKRNFGKYPEDFNMDQASTTKRFRKKLEH